ncbi:MAG: hypothetical protein AAGJ35_11085, partial [Myxococcota bacterium]
EDNEPIMKAVFTRFQGVSDEETGTSKQTEWLYVDIAGQNAAEKFANLEAVMQGFSLMPDQVNFVVSPFLTDAHQQTEDYLSKLYMGWSASIRSDQDSTITAATTILTDENYLQAVKHAYENFAPQARRSIPTQTHHEQILKFGQ